MHREPDVGFDPGTPGSRPGPKAGAKLLRHPGIPIEDKLMARRETEEKGEKQLKDHKDRLREINDSLRRKNLRLIGVTEGAKRTEDQKVYLNKS